MSATNKMLSEANSGDISGMVHKLNTMLSRGAAINAIDGEGNTALMLLAKRFIYKEHSHIFDFLRTCGADFKMTNKEGKSFSQLNFEAFKKREIEEQIADKEVNELSMFDKLVKVIKDYLK